MSFKCYISLKFRNEVFCNEFVKSYATPWAIAQWCVDKQTKGIVLKKGFETSLKLTMILVLNY